MSNGLMGAPTYALELKPGAFMEMIIKTQKMMALYRKGKVHQALVVKGELVLLHHYMERAKEWGV